MVGEAASLAYARVMPMPWMLGPTLSSEAEEDSYWPRLAKQEIWGLVDSVMPTDCV